MTISKKRVKRLKTRLTKLEEAGFELYEKPSNKDTTCPLLSFPHYIETIRNSERCNEFFRLLDGFNDNDDQRWWGNLRYYRRAMYERIISRWIREKE